MVKRTAKILAVLAAAALGWRVGLRYRLTRAVAKDLRSPLLYVDTELIPDVAVAPLSVLARPLELARAVRRPVEISEFSGEFEGHEFHARKLVPSRFSEDPTAAVLWIHGGGHLVGSSAIYDPQNSEIAAELGVMVIAPSYPKSTQAPFPADLDACYAALRWLQENADEMGIDKQRIAIAGDSAGGGLSAAVAQRAHDEGPPSAISGLGISYARPSYFRQGRCSGEVYVDGGV